MKSTKKKRPPAQAESTGAFKSSLLGLYGVVGMTVSSLTPVKMPFAEGFAKDYWRHALTGLALALAVFAGLIGTALYMFDANVFKSQIIDYVKAHKQRDLVLQGDIEVTFFPKLGLDCGKLTLSQRNSPQKFASVDSARLYIAWWPLFRKQVQIERIALDGVHANVIRHKDGSTNFDDLLVTEGRLVDVGFEIEKIRVDDSSVNYRDEAADLTLTLHDLNLETGRLTDGAPGEIQARFRLESSKPRIDTKVKLSSYLLFDRSLNRYELANLEGQAQGEAFGISNLVLDLRGSLVAYPATQQLELDKLNASLKGQVENRQLESRLELSNLKLDKARALGTALIFNATVQQDKDQLSAALDVPAFELNADQLQATQAQANFEIAQPGRTLQGKLSSPLDYKFESRELQLAAIETSLSGSHPLLAGKLSAKGSGDLKANFAAQDIKLGFKAKIDDSNVTGSVQLQDFKSPAYTFDVAVNTLDLDRYLAIDWAQRLQDETTPFDLSGLQGLNLRGKLRSSAEFKFARLKTNKLEAEIRVDQSLLSIDSLNARLYGGATSGSFSVAAADNAKVTLRQKLVGVQLDALLADFNPGEARLIGKGNVALDLSAEGNNMGALRRALTGTASLALARGSLAGLNLGDTLVAGKAQLGLKDADRNETVRPTESTAFTELKSSFDIAQGQARNSDFLLKSPRFTVKGEGEIDAGQLNYRLNTTVAAKLTRSSAGELAELSGITIPLRISGAPASASITLSLGEASGGNLAKLAKLNLAKASGSPTGSAKVVAGK